MFYRILHHSFWTHVHIYNLESATIIRNSGSFRIDQVTRPSQVWTIDNISAPSHLRRGCAVRMSRVKPIQSSDEAPRKLMVGSVGFESSLPVALLQAAGHLRIRLEPNLADLHT